MGGRHDGRHRGVSGHRPGGRRGGRGRGGASGLIARREDDLREVVAGLGEPARYAVADVADPDALATAIARLEAELGPPDVLVANAGIGAYGAFADLTAEEAERIVRVNVLGTVHALRAVVGGMIERRRGTS